MHCFIGEFQGAHWGAITLVKRDYQYRQHRVELEGRRFDPIQRLYIWADALKYPIWGIGKKKKNPAYILLSRWRSSGDTEGRVVLRTR